MSSGGSSLTHSAGYNKKLFNRNENEWSLKEIGKIQAAKNTWLKIYQKEQNGR